MKVLYLIVYYLRRLFTFYVEGKTAGLTDIIRLEQGFYHDFKGLYNKRLGLPINKYKAGIRSKLIEDDIREAASLVIERSKEVTKELFCLCQPDTTLITIYNYIFKLENILPSASIDTIIEHLETIKTLGDNCYIRHIQCARFELDKLLSQIVADFLYGPNHPVDINLTLDNNRYLLKLPYSDYSMWRKAFTGLIGVVFKSMENRGQSGVVEVRLSYPDKTSARIRIIGAGVDITETALTDLIRQGFIEGNEPVQALSLDDETITFLHNNSALKFERNSSEGTTIIFDIEAAKSHNIKRGVRLVSPSHSRILRVTGVTATLGILSYLALAIPFPQLRFWLPPEIYHCELINPMPDRQTAYRGIVAMDKDLHRLWELNFAPYFFSKTEPFGMTRPIVEDINHDNRNEIVLSLQTSTLFSPTENASVICLADNQRELWRYQLGPNPPRAIFGITQHAEGTFTTTFLRTFDFSDLGRLVFVIAVPSLYPTQAILLDGAGKKVEEYWHTGAISLFDSPRDFDGDGKEDIVLYGINNRLGWSPIVTMIEPENFSGQSAPFLDSLFPPAKEKAYYLFGHAWVCDGPGYLESGVGKSYSSVSLNNVVIMGAALKRISGAEGFRYEFYASDGRTICFDNQFNLKAIIVDTSEFSKWWDERKITVSISRNWDSDDLRQLYGYRKYTGGELVLDSITVNPERYDYANYWATKFR